ncbi:ABC transporter ATP-binding protein [Paenibacillus turpanensis]|uniref:ABC transporter ATP-binding protein n=1 Tax=Paenibacillus turpanensis TaxID=2689078 RepID=UPI00140DC47D|nr:ABC transporter ATP-binding protein [Paenibacillus turpanensis]
MNIKIPVREYVRLLHRYLRPQWKSMAGLTLLLLAGIVTQLVSPQIIRYFIDSAEQATPLEALLGAGALFIVVSLLNQVVVIAATYIGENVGWIATNQLRGDLAEHCLRLDMSFHKAQTSGSLIERVDGDINSLANFFSNFMIVLFSNALLMIGIIVLLFRENVLIGLSMLLFVAFALAAFQYIRKLAAPHWSRTRQISAEFYGFLGEHLEGTEDTRANGATGYVMHRFYAMLRRWLPIRLKAFMGWAAMWNTSLFVFALGNAVAFGISAYLWKQGALTMGTVYMIFFYTELLAKPIERIRTQLEDFQKAEASIRRVQELLHTQPAIPEGRGAPLPDGPLAVEFDRVTFGYEEGSTNLDGVTFRLEKGKVLGLLGRTGSGKTTLSRLLMRFYDVTGGSIRLDGVDIRDPYVKELRRRIGLVTQTIEIFEGSVRDNLTFYDDSITDEQIHMVLRELGLDRWAQSLPDGLETRLESGGGGLSAGEAQLLAFARVFLSDPGLIIMDEASSRLDPATEQLIEQAITKLLAGRTCIIIAHRLGTVQRADEILILEDGRMIEYGDRAALAADRGSRFSRMLTAGLEEVLA